MNIEDVLGDSTDSLELERIKNKVMEVYKQLLMKSFKSSNPAGSPEELEVFLEENELEFKGSDDFDEESNELEDLLDSLVDTDDLKKVTEEAYESPDVETTKELKSKSKDTLSVPKTIKVDIQGGLFKTPKDLRSIVNTKALKTPRGTLKRTSGTRGAVNTQSMSDVWDLEREKLLALVRKRNKEHGVRFY